MAGRVLILMGSKSDEAVMKKCADVLREFGVDYEAKILSAHRTPDETAEEVKRAEERGIDVIIAGAGLSAHLPGVVAAHTTLPVIGVPLEAGALRGIDALLSIAQMPPGVPVASVGIGSSQNAALLAIRILALKYPELKEKLKEYTRKMREKVLSQKAEL